MADSSRNRSTAEQEAAAPSRVLLLAPSQGLGGGVERYLETLEWAMAEHGTQCGRVDLPHAGIRGHMAMLTDGRTALRAIPGPVRLFVGHMALLPVATLLAAEPNVCGVWVVCHGCEVWSSRFRPRRRLERALMQRPAVHVIAVSSFTAGALALDCHAMILPPGLSQRWFEMLVDSSGAFTTSGVELATAFRLSAWREKGLPELIDAIASMGREDIQLTICGSGEPSADLLRVVGDHAWCTLRVGLSDGELARQLARADLFVLATRTKSGRHFSGEGFGLVLLEAQVAGTPVVGPAFGGSKDAYVEGITGVSPADETAGALAKVLDEMLGDPARLAWMGKRAAEWARESFAPEHYAQLVARKLL
jgi:phosphatidyl-myo-inositol dimannoside synthase